MAKMNPNDLRALSDKEYDDKYVGGWTPITRKKVQTEKEPVKHQPSRFKEKNNEN